MVKSSTYMKCVVVFLGRLFIISLIARPNRATRRTLHISSCEMGRESTVSTFILKVKFNEKTKETVDGSLTSPQNVDTVKCHVSMLYYKLSQGLKEDFHHVLAKAL